MLHSLFSLPLHVVARCGLKRKRRLTQGIEHMHQKRAVLTVRCNSVNETPADKQKDLDRRVDAVGSCIAAHWNAASRLELPGHNFGDIRSNLRYRQF